MIEVHALSKTYPGGTEALRKVSFRVPAGTVFGLLGPNGAGKSTLIRMVSTLSRPTTGTLRVCGLDPLRQGRAIRRRLGVVSQDFNLDTQMTVRRNLFFHGLYFGYSWRSCRQRCAAVMEMLGVEGEAGKAIHTLSGGTRRKVMLARALLSEPELLVLDEPTAGLDPLARQRVWDIIREHRREGGTVLLSTHHFEEAETLCDLVGILAGGQMGEIAPPTGNLGAEFAARMETEATCLAG